MTILMIMMMMMIMVILIWWWWFSHRLLSWIPSHLCSSWTLPLHSLASDEESFHNWHQMLQIWQLWQKTKVESPGKKNLVPRQILLGLPSLRASSSHLWQFNFICTHKNYFHLWKICNEGPVQVLFYIILWHSIYLRPLTVPFLLRTSGSWLV